MPSALETAIARNRRRIEQREAPIRRSMRDAYQLAITRIESELAITARMLEGQPIPASWFDSRGRFTQMGETLYRQQRLRRLLPQAEAEFRRFTDDGIRLIRTGQLAAISGGAAEAWELMDAAGMDVGFGSRINMQATERIVAAFDSGPVREVLDGYGTRGMEVIERLMIQGVTTGEGPRQIIKRIIAELGDGYTKARLDALVRTTMMDAYNHSLAQQYSSVSHLIRGYRWSAAKSVRSCLACLAMDGRIFKTYQHTQHISCRCVCSPVAIGSTYQYETGEQWFAKQPVATQRAMMPSVAAFDAFANGDLQLKDFVQVKRSRTWGTSIVEGSGRRALEGVR